MDFREITEFIKDFTGYIITVLVLVIVFVFIASFKPVSGNSMYPTLKEGDIVLVSKLFYKLGTPKRNDIVNVKDDMGKSYVKRIIGLPGEKIEFIDNVLYINDIPHKEDFIKENITNNFMFDDICSDCGGVIPDNKYLVLGDNRGESQDSRTSEFGLRDKKDLLGNITIRVWPFNNLGRI